MAEMYAAPQALEDSADAEDVHDALDELDEADLQGPQEAVLGAVADAEGGLDLLQVVAEAMDDEEDSVDLDGVAELFAPDDAEASADEAPAAPADPVTQMKANEAGWARTQVRQSLGQADQQRLTDGVTADHLSPTAALVGFAGSTVRGSREKVDEYDRKLRAVTAGFEAVRAAGYDLPTIKVILGELGSTNASQATMIDPETGAEGYGLFLSDQKFIAHSKKRNVRGTKGGARANNYKDGGVARYQGQELAEDGSVIAPGDTQTKRMERFSPWIAGDRGVADQMGDKARSVFRKSSTNKRNASDAMAKAIVVHELGHVLHARQNPDQFWDQKTNVRTVDRQLSKKVSQYAGANTLEFVAEVFTGTTLGIRYSAAVMAEYAALGGPTVQAPPADDQDAEVDHLDDLDRDHHPESVDDDGDDVLPANAPTNFSTTEMRGSADGKIHHAFTWESPDGDTDTLQGVETRERVVFDRPPGQFMPAYERLAETSGTLELNGATLTKVGSPGTALGAADTHSPGYGPFFDPRDGFVQQEGVLTATQYYEYRLPGEAEWRVFDNGTFTITRTMEQLGADWWLTTEKDGQGSSAKASVRMFADFNAFNA